MATLGTFFTGGYLFSGGSKKPAQQTPPINASSKDEENFIQYVRQPLKEAEWLTGVSREFLKSAEAEDNKQKH